MSNALAEGFLPDQGVVLSGKRVDWRLPHANRYATVLTCGFLLLLVRERADAAGATASSR